jgi:hypothetical protein
MSKVAGDGRPQMSDKQQWASARKSPEKIGLTSVFFLLKIFIALLNWVLGRKVHTVGSEFWTSLLFIWSILAGTRHLKTEPI